MSTKIDVGGSGNFDNFNDLLKTYHQVASQLPKGVSFKLQQNKYLFLQFKHPGSDKRLPKPCGVDFTYDGIYEAKRKAFKVKQALDTISSAAEFWEWYDKEILCVNKIENDLITYREIFKQIEDKFWNSKNKNTHRKRSKEIPNDVATFNRQYQYVFERFKEWDKQPRWEDIKAVLFTWQQGTKSFKDAYSVIKRICSLCPNSERLLEQLSDIDHKQTEFRERQSISLDEFIKWHDETLNVNEVYFDTRRSWLWVASMCIVYGLRPSEIAAALNLAKPYIKDGVTIPALNNGENINLLLVLGDKTYFGTTIKTGGRICKPLCTDKEIIKKLRIQRVPWMPEYKPSPDAKPESICNAFASTFRQALSRWGCPITQTYAFRHLSNQLGEKYGIPQEIRARSLGHSVAVNEQTYKKRNNLQTSIDLLTNHSKQPLSLELATQQLEVLGFDLNDSNVKAILRVVYQTQTF